MAAAETGDGGRCRAHTSCGPVQMHIDDVLPRYRAPVSDDECLYVREFQRLLHQWIVVKVHLADRQIVSGASIGIRLVERFRRESFCFHFSTSSSLLKTGANAPVHLRTS